MSDLAGAAASERPTLLLLLLLLLLEVEGSLPRLAGDCTFIPRCALAASAALSSSMATNANAVSTTAATGNAAVAQNRSRKPMRVAHCTGPQDMGLALTPCVKPASD